jgi:transposase-like protein
MWPKQLWPRPQAAAGRAKGQRLARLKSSYLQNQPYLRRVYLAIVEASKKWIFRHRDWAVIYSQLMIYFGERLAEQV